MAVLRNAVLVMVAALVPLILGVAGCKGDSDFGESVSVPQGRRHAVDGELVAGRSVSLPDDRAFNVTDTQRQSEGRATANSTAAASGKASCVADASKGGSAVAEFQVGHVLAYDGANPFAATVTFDVSYDCSLEGYAPQYGDHPLGLKAYIMDSDRRVLGKVMLAESDPDRVPNRWSGAQSPSFDITFEPGMAYHLIVAGRVEVSGDDTAGATAVLNLRALSIQIVPHPG